MRRLRRERLRGRERLADRSGSGTDAGASTDGMDATVAGGDTDAELFQPSSGDDAGTVTTQGACLPGVYQGSS